MSNQVAILLPVYKKDNPKHFIIALESLLSQTFENLIVYIGCDGPLSGELDKELGQYTENNRIKIIRFSENRGLACVLNDLITEARKDKKSFLARMDADDVSIPERIEKQLTFLQENPDIDVVGGAIEEIDSNGNLRNKKVVYPLTNFECRKFFRYRDPLAHPATFFRMRYFDKTKGYRPEYRKNQDTMLWFDGFMSDCKFSNLPDVVLQFRVNDSFYGRRDGYKRAKQMLMDRFKINKALKYDISSYIFALMMFGMTIAPTFIKRLLYRIR